MKTKSVSLRKKLLLPTALVCVAVVLVISCQKTSSSGKTTSDLQTQKMDVTNDIITANSAADENFDIINGRGEYAAAGVGDMVSSCKTVTYSPSKFVFPHTKTIDYGAGCTIGGITRSGKITVTYYDPLVEADGLYTVTVYDNYHIGTLGIAGSVQVNKVKNGLGQTVLLNIINKTITNTTGDVKDYQGTATWTLIPWDNVDDNAYDITSHTVGKETRNGISANNFQTDVDDAHHVIKPLGCLAKVQGILLADIHIAGGDPQDLNEVLDYGDGTCDINATLVINGGAPAPVTLPLTYWPLNL